MAKYHIPLRIEVSDEACTILRHKIYRITDDPVTARKLKIRFSRDQTWQQFKDYLQFPWEWFGATWFSGMQPENTREVRKLARRLKMPELLAIADAHDAMREDWHERHGTPHQSVDEYDEASPLLT